LVLGKAGGGGKFRVFFWDFAGSMLRKILAGRDAFAGSIFVRLKKRAAVGLWIKFL